VLLISTEAVYLFVPPPYQFQPEAPSVLGLLSKGIEVALGPSSAANDIHRGETSISDRIQRQRIQLEIPTRALQDLGLVPKRFFIHNEALEILRIYNVGGGWGVFVARIKRASAPRTAEEVEAMRAQILRRYGLAYFEILSYGLLPADWFPLSPPGNRGTLPFWVQAMDSAGFEPRRDLRLKPRSFECVHKRQ
jgi:hypothetical protein